MKKILLLTYLILSINQLKALNFAKITPRDQISQLENRVHGLSIMYRNLQEVSPDQLALIAELSGLVHEDLVRDRLETLADLETQMLKIKLEIANIKSRLLMPLQGA